MTPSIVLCADVESMRHPDLIGLAGENLVAQPWLRLCTSGEQARSILATDQALREVWVASSEDVAPINLAAALKRDRPGLRVCLLAFEGTGSLMSRVKAAGVDASLTRQAFVAGYAAAKQRFSTGAQTLALNEGAPGGVARMTLDREATVGASSRNSAFLMPVVSGSGGAGKSTVAALSAIIAQSWGYKTLLIDADLQFGDLREFMDVADALGIDEAIAAPVRTEQLEARGDIPALLAAPKRLEDAEAVVRELPALLDKLFAQFDVIIANTGAAWGEQHALLLERSSKALFLVEQRMSSLRACQHALDLCVRCGMATGPFVFAVNRCSKGSQLTSIDASCALRGAHAVELKDGGRDVEELMSAGQPLELVAAKNEFYCSLEQVLVDVFPDGEAHAARVAELSGGRVERMFGRGRRRLKRGAPCRG